MQLTVDLFLNPLEVVYRMICSSLTNAPIAHRQNAVNADSIHVLSHSMGMYVNVAKHLTILLIAWKVNAFNFNTFATWNPQRKKTYVHIYIICFSLQFVVVVFFRRLNFKVNQVY